MIRLRSRLTAFKRFFVRPRRIALLGFFLTLLLGGITWFILQQLYTNYMVGNLQRGVSNEVNASTEALSSAMDRRIGMTSMLQSFSQAELERTPNFDISHLDSIFEGIYGSSTGAEFICLELADGTVILYPVSNKSHLSYIELVPQIRALETLLKPVETVRLYGPFQTSIGQKMFATRAVIFHNGQVWGTITLGFDLNQFLTDAGLVSMPAGWGLQTGDGSLLSGEIPAPPANPIRKEINMAGTRWELLAAPPQGWIKAVGLSLQLSKWFGFLLNILLAALILNVTYRQARLRQSVEEQTNQLAVELVERQRITEALRHSEEQSRLIVESALDAIFIEDSDGRILDCNEFACRMYGYNRDELLALNVYDLIPSDVAANLPDIITADKLNGTEFIQTFGLRRSGEIFPTEVNIRVVDFSGQRRTIVFVRDLTERRQEQRQLAESELRYRSLVETMPEGVILVDLEGTILFVNQHTAELHGYAISEEMIGRSILDLFGENEREEVEKQLQQIRTTGSMQQADFQIFRRDGSNLWININARLVRDADDKPVYILGVERDVTLRRQSEENLLLQSTALEAASNGIVITDLDGNILWVNQAFTRLTGYSAEEAIHQNPRLLSSGLHSLEFYQDMWQNILSGREWHGRVVNRRKDGSMYTEEMSITPVLSGPQNGDKPKITHFIAIKQDVTDREQNEKRQEAIASIASALRSATGREEIIEIILNQTLQLMEGMGASLMLRNSQHNHLVCVQGVGEWTHWKGIEVSGQTGATARVLRTLTPFVENDIPHSSEPIIRRIFKTEQAVACVPLLAPISGWMMQPENGETGRSEQVLGILWVGREYPFLQNEVQVLNSIADMGASAIQRAALYDETRQRLQRLTAIHALDTALTTSLDVQVLLDELLQQLTGGLGVDAAEIMLISTDGWGLRCAAARGFHQREGCTPQVLRLGEGLAGRVALTQRTEIQTTMLEEYPPVDLERLAGEEIVCRMALPMLAKGELKGVLEVFYRSAVSIDPEWQDYLETLAGQAAIAIDNATLFEQAQASNRELAAAYDTTLEGWARALELRDRETEGHTRRAAELTVRLGRRLGMPENELIHVWRGAILHDIGKLGIPDEILGKPGKLTDAEWEIMRRHPRLGYDLLVDIPYLQPALAIPWCHHEWWDGSGYPRKLRGEEIPLAARIFTVADVWDALRSDRPYRAAWSSEEARAYIHRLSGVQFDPQVVEAFERLLDEESEAMPPRSEE